MKRWGKHQTIWSENLKKGLFPSLTGEISADVVVVGSGITGMTTALQLTEAGKKVVLLTHGEVGQGTTGHSTGHLTEVPDGDLKTLVADFGLDGAQSVVSSLTQAIDLVESNVKRFGLECEFQRVPAFILEENRHGLEKFHESVLLAQELGLVCKTIHSNPMPFPVAGITRVENQAEFNPLAYVNGLARVLSQKGCQIFEDSRVTQIQDGTPVRIHTDEGVVTAAAAVLATHTPVGVYVSLHTRVAPYFSYVMAVRLKNPPAPSGLYWDTATPYHYIRPLKSGSDIWIIGGHDHKTGQEPATLARYLELEEYILERFDVSEILHHWGHELYESVDGLPYIGKIPFTASLYTGTGYSGNGLGFGTVAGKVLADIILERANSFAPMFDPMRVKPIASAGKLIRENANVAMIWMADKLTHADLHEVSRIPPMEGRILDFSGQKIAIYRDENHNFFSMDAACTHMGCSVHWNSAEKTWDCPCHGGRYTCTGKVFSGPPLKDLECVSLRTLTEAEERRKEKVPFLPRWNPLPDELGI